MLDYEFLSWNYEIHFSKKMEGNSNSVEWKEIAISKIDIKVEGNSNFKIAISFHSSIFGKT